MNLRHKLVNVSSNLVGWSPAGNWVLGRLSESNFIRTYIGRFAEFRGVFQFDNTNRIHGRPARESPYDTDSYWSEHDFIAFGRGSALHLRLVPRSDNGVQLIACAANGSPYASGTLITLSGGTLWFHSGINSAFGFRLTANGSLVYE